MGPRAGRALAQPVSKKKGTELLAGGEGGGGLRVSLAKPPVVFTQKNSAN